MVNVSTVLTVTFVYVQEDLLEQIVKKVRDAFVLAFLMSTCQVSFVHEPLFYGHFLIALMIFAVFRNPGMR